MAGVVSKCYTMLLLLAAAGEASACAAQTAPTTTTTAPTTTKKSCGANTYTCSTGTCVPCSWVRDGTNDCTDGGDETAAAAASCSVLPNCINSTITGSTQSCTSVNGAIDGGRCFFIGSSIGSWDQGWTTCSSKGATMAQVHSNSEYKKIDAMLAPQQEIAYIAMREDPGISGSLLCEYHFDSRYWYDSAGVKNTALTASNTWMRYKVCSGVLPTICFWIYGGDMIDADDRCSDLHKAVCHFKTGREVYMKTSVCMTEVPIITISTVGPQKCADACYSKIWCRSFNYIKNTTAELCQLFPGSFEGDMSTYAFPAVNLVTPGGPCTHYNYVPSGICTP